MPKNRDTPALFELVRSSGINRSSSAKRENPLIPEKTPNSSQKQQKPRPSPTKIPTSAPAIEEPATLNQSIRLPLGYLFVACAAVILLLVIAYSVGYSRGNNAAKAQKAGLLTNPGTSAQPQENTTNPTNTNPPQNEPVPTITPKNTVNPGNSSANKTTNGSTTTVDRSTDTRRKSLNYIIVERFNAEEADRVADYLDRQGIDAMVLPSNNRHLRQVVLRRGFDGWSSNREGQALLTSVKQLGRAWKSSHGGTKNFDQAYGNKFGG